MMFISGNPVLAGGTQNDIDDHRSCGNCGMDRKAYGFSRMLVQYEDGTVVGTCSLHCAVVELDANPGKTVKLCSLLTAIPGHCWKLKKHSGSWGVRSAV